MAAGYNRFDLGGFSGGNMRVGDAEREAVASQLREHYAAGRLTLDEMNERLDQVFAARTRSDLAAVTRDLPQAGRPTAGTPGPDGGTPGGQGQRLGGREGVRVGALATLALLPVMLGILGFIIALGSVFAFGFGASRPLGIVLLIAAFALLRRLFWRRRRFARGCGRAGRRW